MESKSRKLNAETFGAAIRSAMKGGVGNETDSGFALPTATLNVLQRLISQVNLKRVVEFGSGKSTKCFLGLGCNLLSIEDSQEWLAATVTTISDEEKVRWQTLCRPLERIWINMIPVRGWPLDSRLTERLKTADLVLIDSPSFPPFREHALISSLRFARSAIVVVDDANIPTVKRFCQRIATTNKLSHYHAPMDHGLFFFLTSAVAAEIDCSTGIFEVLKGWRRYLMAFKSNV